MSSLPIRVNATDRAAGSLGSGAHSNLAASIPSTSASAPAPVSSDSFAHIDTLENEDSNSQRDLAAVKSFLNVSDDPAQDLRVREEKTTKGTCDWLLQLESITNWRDAALETSSSLYWLSGNPGVGKSTLAAHLIRRLQEQNADTCYHFLQRGRRSSQGASGLLRSIAYQMAALHPEVCQDLLELQTWGTVFDRDDVKAIWRKIFTNCILHLQFSRPQFWIIDGLDECIGVEELLAAFAKLDPNARIRILFTSRPLPNLEDIQSRVDHHRSFHHKISVNNTQPDIKQFVDSKLEGLRLDDQDREMLAKTVVDEADGVFLRARLILEEAAITSSRKGAHRAAADAPMGIERLYERVVRAMAAEGPEYTGLTRKILEWATCGIRPLTIDEFRIIPSLQGLDTGVFKRGEPLIEISADNTIHMIHTTARDMLLDPASPCAFSINEARAHEHLALDCFRHLEQAELSVPCLNFGESSKNDFGHYACMAVFEHLAASSSSSEDLLLQVNQFLRTNVLRWLAYLLHKNGDLYHVIQASKNLRTYLDACRSLRLTHRQQYENISLWQVDLLQIVLKYGPQLLEQPSAVSSVLPGLCPTDSAIFKQFGQSSVCLRLRGVQTPWWDDCVAQIERGSSHPTVLATSHDDSVLAMGLATGTIEIYDNIHYRELACLDHGESVKHVRFDESGKHLVSVGRKSLKLWSLDGELLWSAIHSDTGTTIASVEFSSRDRGILTLGSHGHVLAWRAQEDGEKPDYRLYIRPPKDIRRGRGDLGPSCTSSFSPKGGSVAIAFQETPLQIWSTESGKLITSCYRRRLSSSDISPPSVRKVLFNPDPAIELIAALYDDKELVLFRGRGEEDEQHEVKSVHLNAESLACSADGRILATLDAYGNVSFWDFETLDPIYQSESQGGRISPIAMSSDGMKFYSADSQRIKIWEPAAIAYEVVDRPSARADIGCQFSESAHQNRRDVITHIAPSDTSPCLLAARNDGTMFMYDLALEEMSTLSSHEKLADVTGMSWGRDHVVSADISGVIKIHKVIASGGGGWTLTGEATETQVGFELRDASIHPTLPLIHLFGRRGSALFDLRDREQYPLPSSDEPDDWYRLWLWMPLPSKSAVLLGVRKQAIDIYTTDQIMSRGFPTTWDFEGIGADIFQHVESVQKDDQGRWIALSIREGSSKCHGGLRLLVFRLPQLAGEEEDRAEISATDPVVALDSSVMHSLLGFYGSSIVYLDKQMWVCSIDLSELEAQPEATSLEKVHFFIPAELVAGGNTNSAVSKDGLVVIAKGPSLISLANGLHQSLARRGLRCP